MSKVDLLADVLSQFEMGKDGFPNPGKVIRYYREKMTYTDQRTGIEKHWTQADLAEMLNLTEVMVNLMEKKNKGLDSIERRRTLATLLKIPPILLGLGSLDDIVSGVTGVTVASNKTQHSKINENDILMYENAYNAYSSLFRQGLTSSNIVAIEEWTKRLSETINNGVKDKKTLLRILWYFETLCEKVYTSDFLDYTIALKHNNNALEIACLLEDTDLKAASMYNGAVSWLRQGRTILSGQCVEQAINLDCSKQAKGALYMLAGKVCTSSNLMAQKYLEMSEKCIGVSTEKCSVGFSKANFLIGKSTYLMGVNRQAKAIETFEEVKTGNKRLKTYIDLSIVRCYVEQKKPEYDHAISLLQQIVSSVHETRIQWHMNMIESLYTKLQTSSYGKSPDVADFGMLLRELRLKR
jgi:transcriptional regulator with XRE-family HTH domain